MIKLKNNYIIKDEYILIELNRRDGTKIFTKVDLEDLEKIDAFNLSWHSVWNEHLKSYYVRATKYMGTFDGKPKYKMVYLHRVVMDASENEDIDHINHDTLDNRKSNLNKTPTHINLINRKGKNKNNTSGYRNVSWSESEQKYIVQLQINGVNTKLGSFVDVDEAGKFAKKMRQKYYIKKYNDNIIQ